MSQQQQQQQRTYAQLAKVVSTEQQASTALLDAAIATFVRSCRPEAAAAAARRGQMMELEVRFRAMPGGGKEGLLKPSAPFTQSDYERVARTVTQYGWKSADKNGDTILRIAEDRGSSDRGSGRDRDRDTIRAEIHGTAAIQAYCRHNTLESVLEHRAVSAAVRQDTVYFTRKSKVVPNDILFPNLEFRVALSQETQLLPQSEDPAVRRAREQWSKLPKFFRHMNRVRFQEPAERQNCVVLDLSIVHSNRLNKTTGKPATGTTTGAVGLFGGHTSHTEYEVELEIDNNMVTRWLTNAAAKANAKAKSNTAAADPQQQQLTPAETEVRDRIKAQLQRTTRLIMGALQDTLYPKGRLERNAVLDEYYAHTLYRGQPPTFKKPYFVGPSPVTLKQENCLPSRDGGSISILDNYCVTDKADGSRALLFVSKSVDAGAVYMITGALQVQFTGMHCSDDACLRLLLDGEYITGHDKSGKPLNLFAAFDLYAARDHLLMGLPFADLGYGNAGSFATVGERGADVPPSALPPYRLPQMQHYVARLAANLSSRFPTAGGTCSLAVRAKEFYLGSSDPGEASIFDQSKRVLDGQLVEYETDGLIFTPTDTAVNGDKPVLPRLEGNGGSSRAVVLPSSAEVQRALASFVLPHNQTTWYRAFKWKPADRNTNDFLVTVASPQAEHITIDGQTVFYKRLKLLCGYNSGVASRPAKFMTHGTPVYNMLMDVLPDAPVTEQDRNGLQSLQASLDAGENNADSYKPRAFVPSLPYDLDAQYCCLPLGRDNQLRAENGDPIDNATIVEFRFERPPGELSTSWGWKPIIVRQDKTAKLRAGESQFGNPYTTANDNWKSMHYPVTRDNITGVTALDADSVADDVYYKTAAETEHGNRATKLLSDFHNRVVKKHLLQRVADSVAKAQGGGGGGGLNMIDFAVGKAGDIHAWKRCNLDFVLGLDLSRDNIFNVKDGAIARAQARYYDPRGGRRLPVPRCIFLPADSSRNIRSQGTAFGGSMDRGGHRIVRALFGDQAAPPQTLSPRFERIVAGGPEGVGGFQIGSCQFALHYFWKSHATLHGFLRNLSECIQMGGLFVGTCYDGKKIFDLLAGFDYAGPTATASPQITGSGMAPHYRLHSKGDRNGGGGNKLLLSIAKKYTAVDFDRGGPASVGLAVSVFMESIAQALDEYLVHFPYLDELMDVYGFDLVPEDEMVRMGFKATGEGGRRSFERMFEKEARIVEGEREPWWNMSAEEKTISFLNSLFVYRKKRSLTAEALDGLHRQYVEGAPAAADAAAAATKTTSKTKKTKRPRPSAYNLRFTGEFVVL